MTTKRTSKQPDERQAWPTYQRSYDYLLDLFPGGREAAMIWADLVAGMNPDERFSQVAAAYRRLNVRERETVPLAELCEEARLRPSTFLASVVAYAMMNGANVSAIWGEMIVRPARFMALFQLAMEQNRADVRISLMAESGLL